MRNDQSRERTEVRQKKTKEKIEMKKKEEKDENGKWKMENKRQALDKPEESKSGTADPI